MRRLIAVAVLLFSGPVSGSWPERNDTIYVPARLINMKTSIHWRGDLVRKATSEIDPCVPLVVKGRKLVKAEWTLRDPAGGREILSGDWIPRMHDTRAGCQADLNLHGEVSYVRYGIVHRIMSTDADP